MFPVIAKLLIAGLPYSELSILRYSDVAVNPSLARGNSMSHPHALQAAE